MVPGSTFRYGSNFIMFTRSPRLSSRQPIEAAASPLPRLDTTPPVTKTYFADIDATSSLKCWDWPYLVGTIKYDRETKAKKVEIQVRLIQKGTASLWDRRCTASGTQTPPRLRYKGRHVP